VLAAAGCLLVLPFALGLVRDRPRGAEAAAREDDRLAAEAAARGLTLAEARRTASFWILAGVLFAFYFYYLGVNYHLVAYLTDAGFSPAAAALQFSFAIAVGILGKIGMGLVADRVPARRAIVLTFALMTAGSFVLLALERAPALRVVFLTLHGVTVAAENVVLPLVVAECFGIRHMARIYGAIMLALLPGGMCGAVFAGWVFDTSGSYRLAFTTFAALNLAAVAALGALRPLGAEHGR
jgi:MFS family permease